MVSTSTSKTQCSILQSVVLYVVKYHWHKLALSQNCSLALCVTQATIHFVKIYLHAFLVISQVKCRVSNPKICLLTCLSRISIKLKQRNSLHLFKQEVNKRQRGHKQKQIACMRSPNLSESSLARPPQNI